MQIREQEKLNSQKSSVSHSSRRVLFIPGECMSVTVFTSLCQCKHHHVFVSVEVSWDLCELQQTRVLCWHFQAPSARSCCVICHRCLATTNATARRHTVDTCSGKKCWCYITVAGVWSSTMWNAQTGLSCSFFSLLQKQVIKLMILRCRKWLAVIVLQIVESVSDKQMKVQWGRSGVVNGSRVWVCIGIPHSLLQPDLPVLQEEEENNDTVKSPGPSLLSGSTLKVHSLENCSTGNSAQGNKFIWQVHSLELGLGNTFLLNRNSN